MNKEEFKRRTQEYALQAIAMVETLPRTRAADVIGRQLLRPATSVGANYRAACRAKSAADFIAKMGVVEEEADECLYWLELLSRSGLRTDAQLAPLLSEGNELLAMTVSSITTTRQRAANRRNM